MGKFILTSDDQAERDEALDARPTQVEIRERGLGNYTLRREDGSVIRHYTVSTNRNSNPKVTTATPEGLAGVTTLNLGRLLKAYTTVVKYWPVKTSDRKRVEAEIAYRDRLLSNLAFHDAAEKAAAKSRRTQKAS